MFDVEWIVLLWLCELVWCFVVKYKYEWHEIEDWRVTRNIQMFSQFVFARFKRHNVSHICRILHTKLVQIKAYTLCKWSHICDAMRG